MRFGSLFTGIGGLDLGLERAYGLRYAEPDDAYSDQTDAYVGTQREGVHLYAIGAHGWTWLEAEHDLELES